MSMDLLAVHKVAPFSGETASPQQTALGTAAAEHLCAGIDVEPYIKAHLCDYLTLISVDNQWIVDGIVTYPVTGNLRGVLFKTVISATEDEEYLLHHVSESVFRLGLAVVVLSFMDECGLSSYFGFDPTAPFSTRNFPEMTEIDSRKVISWTIAAFVYQEPGTGSFSPEQVAPAADRLEGQLLEILPVLPELLVRKTLEQGTIDVLLASHGAALREGEL